MVSSRKELDKLATVGIGIVCNPVDAPRQRRPKTIGRAKRIDAGAEIEDLVPAPSGPPGQLAEVSAMFST
jgi:hypothetical protein